MSNNQNSVEFEDIIASLCNLNIENNTETEMPADQKNIPLLRYQADNIPLFDGNPKLLNRFLNSCENLINNFRNVTDPNDPINVCLFDTVLSKLRDRAADLISSRSDLNTWAKVKETLELCFADQRSIDCLIQDLISLKPQKNENPIQFGMRIQDVRSLLFAKLCTINNVAEKNLKIAHYNDFALKTYINGLPYNLQLIIRLKQPDSVERAMAYVTEEENFIYFCTGKNQNLSNDTYKPQNRLNPLYQPSTSNQTRPNLPIIPHIQNILPRLPMNFNRPQILPNYNRPLPFNNYQPKFHSNVLSQYRSPLIHNFPYKPPMFRQHYRPNFQNIPQNIPQNRFPITQPNFNKNSALVRTQYPKPEPMDTSSVQSPIRPKQNFHIDNSEEINEASNINLQDPNIYDTSQYYEDNYFNHNFADYNYSYPYNENYECDITSSYYENNNSSYIPDNETHNIQDNINSTENFQQISPNNTIT